ncbi:MAG TPA: hypothetical protein VLC93_15755, partial [Myxococcota bacterium]|nr:hypothetical protein [Myxococcota bacterium]
MLAPTIAALAVLAQTPSHAALNRGRELLARFELEPALTALEAAAHERGYGYEDNVALWEALGIARAYADRRQAAEEAFVHLLAIAPNHVLSYTLSPKATFPYEAARRRLERQPVAAIDYVWPRGQLAGDPLPVTIDILRDDLGLMRKASVCAARGDTAVTCAPGLPTGVGKPAVSTISAPADTPVATETVALYVLLYDDAGNVVQRSADPKTPRLLQLPPRENRAWYQRWYTWAAAAGVLAVTTGIIVH